MYTYVCSLLYLPPTPLHPTSLGHPRALSRALVAIEQLPSSHLFYSWQCAYVKPSLSVCPAPPTISPPCQISCHRPDPVSPGLLADSVPVFGSQPSFPSSPTSLLVTALACWGSEGVDVLICLYVNLCSSLPLVPPLHRTTRAWRPWIKL